VAAGRGLCYKPWMDPERTSLRERDEAERQRLWRLTGMGGTLATEVLAGAAIGWLLDRVFGTKPILIVVCTVAGVVVGMVTFIRRASREVHNVPSRLPPALPPEDETDEPPEDDRP